ncbi:MAG TPA: hypothetical protein VGE98_06795 [Thermoanaerobaculia bacterium]
MLALQFVSELFGQEKITNLGLEEVVSDEDTWRVTVGFSRPWDYPPGSLSWLEAIDAINGPTATPEREYKVVKVDASTGEIKGLEIRD